LIPPSEEVMRQSVMPVLDGVARRCRDKNAPLLTLMATYFDNGKRDYDAAVRHWKMRYDEDLTGTSREELDEIFDAEEARVHVYCLLNPGKEML
jgi:hypothetical protein